MAKQKNSSKEADTSTAKSMFKMTAEALAEASQGYEPPEAIQGLDPIITPSDEYNRLYGWIHKGDVDTTLKAILKELVRIRLGVEHV